MSAPGAGRLTTVCRLLNAEHAQYVVVGGFALALHGVVRATKDIDLLVEPSIENVRRTLAALAHLTFGVASELDAADVAHKPLTIIGDNPRVDILTLAWSVRYADAAPGAHRVTVDGVEIPFADTDTLIRTKQTGRLQDAADIEALQRARQLGSADSF